LFADPFSVLSLVFDRPSPPPSLIAYLPPQGSGFCRHIDFSDWAYTRLFRLTLINALYLVLEGRHSCRVLILIADVVAFGRVAPGPLPFCMASLPFRRRRQIPMRFPASRSLKLLTLLVPSFLRPQMISAIPNLTPLFCRVVLRLLDFFLMNWNYYLSVDHPHDFCGSPHSLARVKFFPRLSPK